MYRMVLRHDVGGQAPGFALKDGTGREADARQLPAERQSCWSFSPAASIATPCGACGSSSKATSGSWTATPCSSPSRPSSRARYRRWSRSMSLPFTVLSDPEMKVVKEYDVYDPVANWTWPAAFIIDKERRHPVRVPGGQPAQYAARRLHPAEARPDEGRKAAGRRRRSART